jgi:putative tryptophan/tyrosine transport system substrate-binding protein
LWDPATSPIQTKAIEAAAGLLNVKLTILEVRAPAELDATFASVSQVGAGALLILSSPIFGTNPKPIADLTLRHKLPAITLFPDFARFGGLMAYGPSLPDSFRQVGIMAGKVLKGTKPADLPVERPTKFEMVVNLKTAREIGVTLATSILLRADEVVE